MTKQVFKIPEPTVEIVADYQIKWGKLEHYKKQEDALTRLFKEMYPENTHMGEVLIKVASLNTYYSTNIWQPFNFAKRITSKQMNFDDRVKRGDVKLVKELAKMSVKYKNGKERDINFISFSSKYCSFHNNEIFPIYDKFVVNVLIFFNMYDEFIYDNEGQLLKTKKVIREKLKDYCLFRKTMIRFQEIYGLDGFDFKEIDRYLWQLGKEMDLKKGFRINLQK